MDGFIKIKGFEDYLINEESQVYSTKRNKFLTPHIKGNGYYEVTMAQSKGVYKQKGLHRLLAENFIPNPNNLKQINHKDGNTLNFKLDNLEWISASDNTMHSRYVLEKGNNKKTIAINKITGETLEFKTQRECARYFKISVKYFNDYMCGRYIRIKKLDSWDIQSI